MSPSLSGISESDRNHGSGLVSSSSALTMDSLGQHSLELKERNYMGIPDTPSVSDVPCQKVDLNLKATELRLGLPGSQSPNRTQLDEKSFFPLHPTTSIHISSASKHGNKRGFSDAMDEGKFQSKHDCNATHSSSVIKSMGEQQLKLKDKATSRDDIANEPKATHKAQVVGWPPLRSFRKNTLSSTSKNTEEVDNSVPGTLFVKVSMDGAPYLRKIDLGSYSSYQNLSSALEMMFSCFIIGKYGCPESGREILSESKLKDLVSGCEYVLTYEDKDEDWMLVGDVPWEMFIETCKRLRIMKSSDAIGLAPRVESSGKVDVQKLCPS